MGAPEGAAAGRLALWRLLPGWPGGAGHMDGSVRGRAQCSYFTGNTWYFTT